jgi:hypothetical protein
MVEKGQPHVPFFSAELAEDLLADLKRNLPHSQPVPLTTEIPLSSTLERVFDSAKALQAQFRQKQMEPLHFLAAILKEDSGEGGNFCNVLELRSKRYCRRLAGAERISRGILGSRNYWRPLCF